jgi:hypothetical protein
LLSLTQVMNKELVDPLAHSRWQYDPADADYAWVAKVMLLASPAREELIAKTCHLAGTVAANSLKEIIFTKLLEFSLFQFDRAA